MSALWACGGPTPVAAPEQTQTLKSPYLGSSWHKKHHDDDSYEVERLVSNDKMKVPAEFEDPLLQNAWGLAAGSGDTPTFWWVADNGSMFSTLYDGEGMKQSLEVSLHDTPPTGLVFTAGTGFPVTDDTKQFTGPARFIFAGEDGTIQAWSPAVPPPPPSHFAWPVVPSSGAVYKGLAIAATCDGTRIYATDFHNRKVDVYDDSWNLVSMPCDAFIDPHLPKGFAPFGIREIFGKIFVTYAKQDDAAHDDVKGPGNGFVSAFDTDGKFLFRVATRGVLNSPWGLVVTPKNFGKFSNKLLIGNFGDGRIHAFDLKKCSWIGCEREGTLRDEDGEPIFIDGLWALDFGKGNAMTGNTNSLYFTSGPNDEADGLFGYIEPAEEEDD
jgi:uncharacterized protein (TIGR03118 family)